MELEHKEQFHDVKEVVIPGTKERVSNTQQNEQITKWMAKTGHLPLMYQRERDGIHCEISELFEKRIYAAFEQGSAIGEDGRKYTLGEADETFPMCGSICIRATPEGEEHGEAYDITFFV
jgi:hypothetical protein